MLAEVERINKLQLNSKKPILQNDQIHYDWQDGSLLKTLSTGIDRCWEHSTKGNEASEKQAVRVVNEIIEVANDCYEYKIVEDMFKKAINDADSYAAKRLSSLKYAIVDDAVSRKGVLIYGEGGIGKTRFLYELTSKLEKAKREFAIAFDQRGVLELSKLGIQSISESCPKGFTLIIDACNELDDDAFSLVESMIEAALLSENVSVVVTTRTESPKSRLDTLKKLLPCSREFEGVDPYIVFDLVSEYPDELLIQYQDMLMSRNPRNLNAMLKYINGPRFKDNSLKADTKRTALIEECVKYSMSKNRWEQTKLICSHLYQKGASSFTYDEVKTVIGESVDQYIADMISEGFLIEWTWEALTYSFSSESQMWFLIARSLNGDLDDLAYNGEDADEFAKRVAIVVAEKSCFMNQQEMVQVAIDRYCSHGIKIVMALLRAFDDADIQFEWERVLTQTIFPVDSDFSEVAMSIDLEPDYAFLHFGGYLNTPFNLSNYANEKLICDAGVLGEFYLQHWQTWQLGNLIQRVRSISEYVARTGDVPKAAEVEWSWLAIWSSMSGNKRLRALGQRLLFMVCDSCSECVSIACEAWKKIDDVYIKRSIAKTFSALDRDTKSRADVSGILAMSLLDPNLTDSITMAYLCRISRGCVVLSDFNSRNWYEELGEEAPSAEDLKAFKEMVWFVDLMNKGYFPFDVYQSEKSEIDYGYGSSFIDAPKTVVAEWNRELRGKLSCGANAECGGLYMHPQDFDEILPIDFEISELNKSKLMNAMVSLAAKWFKKYGGTLDGGLGKFRSDDYFERDSLSNPNLKPLDLAAHDLLGSLAANYYTKDILLGDPNLGYCGFGQYEELMYNEPGNTQIVLPAPSSFIDNVRRKIASKMVSSVDKDDAWFDDVEEVKQELFSLIEPVRADGKVWRPLALNAREKIREKRDLAQSNEFLISVGFHVSKHIDGGRNDRYFTIEHNEYPGNMKDYSRDESTMCLYRPEPEEDCSVRQKNSMLLPPPTLIRELDLDYDQKTGCFVDRATKEVVVVCDGNPAAYYEEPVCNLILIRDEVFAELVAGGGLMYFAFTERYREGFGYENMCSRHWEFSPDRQQISHYSNYSYKYETLSIPETCRECYFSEERRRERRGASADNVEYVQPDWLKEILSSD